MNARFNVWHNGQWCKITLAPGDAVEVSSGGPTDEGYRSARTVYTHRGTYVTREWYTRERDCDGLLERYGEDKCSLLNLRSVEAYPTQPDPIMIPSWSAVRTRQRDHTAEAAGY